VLIVVSWFNVVVILIMDDLNFLERDQYFLGCDRQCAMFRKLDLPESSSLFFFNPTASIRVPFFWSFRIDKETICSMQYAVCSMQYAVCSMQYAVCSMQYAVCSMNSYVQSNHFYPGSLPNSTIFSKQVPLLRGARTRG
jgi:hypothetical protein